MYPVLGLPSQFLGEIYDCNTNFLQSGATGRLLGSAGLGAVCQTRLFWLVPIPPATRGLCGSPLPWMSPYNPCDAFRVSVWPDRSSRMCNWPSRNWMSSTPWKPSGARVQNIR